MIASYDYHRGTVVVAHAKGFTPCRTEIVNAYSNNLLPIQRLRDATSGLEFDPTGEFLASVNRVGCLTIQRFQTLRYYSDDIVPKTGDIGFSETLSNKIDVFHVNSAHEFEAIRWNTVKQNQVLRPNRGTRISDVAFNGSDDSRLYGSGLNGIVNVRDPRTSYLPCLELVTHELVHDILSLKSIQLHLDSQKVFGGDHSGNVFMWDIRNPSIPTGVWNLQDLLVTLGYVEDDDISPLGCQSILINPNRKRHIAFHLQLGWSGILDFESSKISHLHHHPCNFCYPSSLSLSLQTQYSCVGAGHCLIMRSQYFKMRCI
ncbi:unnamed protein product [Linum trigynum]|uniref:Uncharacterized protein n=1 Tax=Linum trigynum TaxID=586398 RepID=A0AAV2GII2_9ROSI